MTMEVYFWTVARGVFLMRGVNDLHQSDISFSASLNVLISDLLSFLKTRLVTVDEWKGVGGTERVYEEGWRSVPRFSE